MRLKKYLLFFLLFFISFLPLFQKVEAKNKFTAEVANIRINYGINGYFRANSVLLINFKFTNVRKNFNGKIEIRYFSDSGASCSIIKNLELRKGEKREVCFFPYLNSDEPKFIMMILDGSGRKVWEKESSIDLFDTDANSDIVIAELDGAGAGHYFKGESNFNVKRRAINKKDIPSNYLGLKPFDIIVIPNDYLSGNDEREIALLKERQSKGGIVVEEKNLSKIDIYKASLMKEGRDDWMWRVEKVVGSILRDLTVKGGRYILVFFFYILLVSPVAYYILYRMKKRNLYYVVVPVIAVLFTLIMYGVGTDSRISGLRINYISVLDLRLDSNYENTIFAVTNSTNRSYDITVSNGYRVEPAFGLYGLSEDIRKLDGKIKRKVYEQTDRTDITIGEGAAFETVYFRAEGKMNYHFGSMGKLSREKEGLKGEFRNKLGIDLENVFALYDDEIIYLGGVKSGKIKEFDSETSPIFLSDLTTHVGESNFLKDIFHNDDSHDEASKELLMSMLLEKLANRNYDKPVFLGITKNKLYNEFATKINGADGYSIFILSANSEPEKPSLNFVNSIHKLGYTIEEEKDSFLHHIFPSRQSTTVTYEVPNEPYSKLSYYRRYNGFINPYEISLKNYQTGEFDTVFLPDSNYRLEVKEIVKNNNEGKKKEGLELYDLSFVGLSGYIKDGKLTVRYEIEPSVHNNASSYMLNLIPKLSLE